MEWQELRGEIVATTTRVGELLRAVPTGDLPLARVDWSAAETGAHLVSVARRYRGMVRRSRRLPDSLAEDNRRALAEVPERDPGALADLLTSEVGVLLDVLGPDGDRPTWYFACPHTSAGLGAIMLTELLMHGLDLAQATGRPCPSPRTRPPRASTGSSPR
ncbi:maleylpyruvate isomerase N-terminal domain-containing protein [Actinophytocola sp. NPDC049390]|uniref:maleylpyruvate isomerase N-terminal domain-containing protein n=1 Tax=Actinophytocola sp. NPDC049390 TaxID=3363894 RepID=UPI0037982EEC